MILARVLAAGSAVSWAVVFFGLIDLSVPLDQTPGFYESYVLETGWGLLYTVLVGAAFGAVVVRPRLVAPLVQVALAGLVVGVTALLAGARVQLVPALLLVLDAGIVLAVARLRPPRWSRPDPALALVAALLAVPAAFLVADLVAGYRDGRPPTDDDTWGIDHWPMQAALVLALVLVAVAVSAGLRWPGIGVSVACVAVAAAWFGAVSLAYPDHAGSAGARGGVALVAWAVLFAVVAVLRLRRTT